MRSIPIYAESGAMALSDEQADPEVDFIGIPREVSTFEMPRLPDPGPASSAAHRLLADFVDRYGAWLASGGEAPALELAGIDAATRVVVDEALGEGEVSAIADAGDGLRIRIQETVFAGVWREQRRDAAGRTLDDRLIGAAVPAVLGRIARERSAPRLRERPVPATAMNVQALVTELQDAIDRCDEATPARVINLTLLPLSPADVGHLDALLEGGAVVILSRGFGNCRVSSTAARDVWRVQYFNTMQTLILNTIEVCRMPEAALAAREDLEETHQRLADLVLWMGTSSSP
ncbi:MAG: hydrogenase expression/formation protein [Burkholderiales bacterium]|nr:hydrogenase expression/formation protein [Burkholderiales bacterium]